MEYHNKARLKIPRIMYDKTDAIEETKEICQERTEWSSLRLQAWCMYVYLCSICGRVDSDILDYLSGA